MNWLLDVPDRNTWFKVEAREGTAWNDRERWCKATCTRRWLQQDASRITEFENHQEAVMFALKWG